ncbi:hypothetical protein HQN87_02905 [Paenibacillus tritici]|uniref:Copper amine oxidase-like N-terminal domain-containing protein n=1 Tax=Paenibacillus tritici TaxID=1873425 RepID=A0ABX2DJL0_9BACL|nr:hypothetical protein [Paenibacillus tritici]NQX44269.1 hypothetical protein [Paenibacillus tritici]
MKKIALLLTTLLLTIGLIYPGGTGRAAAAAAPAYTEISTFVEGKLLITPVKSVLVNGSAYVPVKLVGQIPGFTVAADTAGVTLTGSKGSAKLNKDNSVLYKSANYVAFKTLLKLGAIDGKYASSAISLFIWSTEDGKNKSNSMLYAISKLPGTMGIVLGKKVYLYGHPGSHWVKSVQYVDDYNQNFVMQNEAGTEWVLDLNDFVDNTMYTMESIDYLKYYYNGLTVWTRNALIADSPFKNFEKATIANFRSNPANGNLEMIIRRANGQEVPLEIEPRDDYSEYVEDILFFKNPQTAFKISDKMWSAIREERAVSGMTITELLLSWGDPDSVHEGYVVYGDQYVYFINDKVYSIVNL